MAVPHISHIHVGLPMSDQIDSDLDRHVVPLVLRVHSVPHEAAHKNRSSDHAIFFHRHFPNNLPTNNNYTNLIFS